MHEYSLVESLLATVETQASDRGATAVTRLTLSVGELSGLDPTLFRRAFDTFRERTICERAELVMREVPARWSCRFCGTSIDRGAVLACPVCGGAARLTDGDEITLERIEMEVP